MISIIVAASENDVIGDKGKIPWYLPRDLKHFANLTRGHTIVMGRKTYDSILAHLGKPLPDRENIIVTTQKDFKAPGCVVVNSLEEAMEKTKGKNVFIAGGANIYELALPYAHKLYLTRVHAKFNGDTKLPYINHEHWREVKKEFHPRDEKNKFDLTFYLYERKK